MAERITADDFLNAPEVRPEKPQQAPAAISADEFLSAPEYTPPETEKPKPLYSSMGDIGKSLASGAADAVYALPGVPGSIVNAGRWIGDRLRTGYTNAFGYDPATLPEYWFGSAYHNPNAIDTAGRSEKEVAAAIREQAKGRPNLPGVDLPSMGQMVEKAHEAGLPYHTPESGLGEAAHAAGNIGAGLAVAPVSVASKVLGTIEGSVGAKAGELVGEKLGDYAGKNGYGDFFGVTPEDIKAAATTVGGGLAVGNGLRVGQKYKSGLARADQDLARAAAQDEAYFRANPQERPPLTTEEAAARGMRPLEAAGPNVRARVARAADTPEGQDLLGGYNAHVSDLANTTDRVIGPIRSAGEQYRARQEQLRDVNNANYTQTMSLPHAQSVWTPELEGLLKRVPDQYIREAVRLSQLEGGTNVTPPRYREPQPARQQLDIPTQTLTTIDAVPGGWYAHPEAPPNLAFWDYLKKAMDDDLTNQTGPLKNVDTNRIRATRGLKNEIIGNVDQIVPEYAATRGTAADLFGARDAVKQGANFLKNRDSFTEAEVSRALEQMPPDHRAAFASGFLGDLQRMITDDPGAATRLLKRPGFQRRLRMVAGNNVADQIITASRASKVNPVDAQPSLVQRIGHGLIHYGVPPGLVHAGASILEHGSLGGLGTVNPVTVPIAAYQVGKQLVLSKVGKGQQARANREILQRMTTPGGQRAYAPPDAPPPPPRVEPTINGIGGDQDFSGAPPLTIRPSRRKAGGEVGPAGRGKINVDAMADALVKQVDAARAALSGQTEGILAAPDAHVVKALSVARSALG